MKTKHSWIFLLSSMALLSPVSMAAKARATRNKAMGAREQPNGAAAKAASDELEQRLRNNLLRTSRGPTAEERAQRALIFDRLGIFELGLVERLQSVRDGQKVSAAELAKLGDSALALDRIEDVTRVVQGLTRRGVDSASLPASLRAVIAAYYLRLGDLERASQFAPSENQIAAMPPLSRYKAALLTGAVLAAQNKNDAAASALSLAADSNDFDPGLIYLQRSRVFFEMGRYDQVLEELMNLPRNSASWYSGMMVSGWASYKLHDYNLSLGQMMSLHSPYLNAKFSPESYILEAENLYRLCHYESAKRSLGVLKSRFEGVAVDLSRLRRQISSRLTGVATVLNFARGRTDPSGDFSQEHWNLMMDGILSQEPLVEVDRSLLQIEKASNFVASLGNSSNRWVQATVKGYRSELDAAKLEALRKGLTAVNHRIDTMISETNEALENALAIDVEIGTRIRDRLVSGQIPKLKKIDFQTEIKKGYEFWPYQGEFWRDEAGSYVFATTDVCGGEGAGS